MPERNDPRYRVPDSERYYQDSERPYDQLKDLNMLPA